MSRAAFAHVRHWIFDLDNTLYPPGAGLFDQVGVRMTDWVMEALGVDRAEADRLRDHYWETYGTTLAGLMSEHRVDPEAYLLAVHEVTLDTLEPDPVLAAAIAGLPGRKIVYTNGSAPYAGRVLAARGLAGLFDAVYGVEHAGYRPKPERAAFEAIFAASQTEPQRAAMFEDDPRNLVAPHAMGLRTVLVGPPGPELAYVEHRTDDLAGFLLALAATTA